MKQLLLLIISVMFISAAFAQIPATEKIMTKEDFKKLTGREKEIMRQWCKKNQVMYPIYLDTTITNQNKWDVYNYSVLTIERIDQAQNEEFRKRARETKEAILNWDAINNNLNQLSIRMQQQQRMMQQRPTMTPPSFGK